ncbi:hypothetical protein ACIRBX_07690 [Kitasatospora sp. NPDC096147]|uniref:hypothetical protein n=1 Tax=Kitasatospora sp. NPDC096147 TaxID=3364093 RepID=UPI0038127A33
MDGRTRADGCGWTAARWLVGFLLATTALFTASDRVQETWHWCLTQDHEVDPDAFPAMMAAWGIAVVTVLSVGAVVHRLPYGSWYVLPVMAAVAALLGWLYLIGMGSPAPVAPDGYPEDACRTLRVFPFLD